MDGEGGEIGGWTDRGLDRYSCFKDDMTTAVINPGILDLA